MSGTLPRLSSGNVCMLPLSMGYSYATSVVRFQNGSEQRAQTRPGLAAFQLTYTNISATDRASIDTFFAAQKGSADSSWNFVLDPTQTNGTQNFLGCTFDQDLIQWTENKNFPNYYSTSLRFHQTYVGGLPAGYNPGGFPALGPPTSPYLSTGYPFVSGNQFSVASVDLPVGPRYTYPWFAGGLSNFPTRALKMWLLTLSSVDYTIVAKVAQHFIGCLGRYTLFAFNDPTDGKQYRRVRYDMDTLSITSQRQNNYSMQLKLVEVYGPGWTS